MTENDIKILFQKKKNKTTINQDGQITPFLNVIRERNILQTM